MKDYSSYAAYFELLDTINAGFNMTSSGKNFFSPVESGILLSKSRSARSKW